MSFIQRLLQRKQQKGFSLGEVILAAFVLTMGIFSTIGLITFSYRTSDETQDLIIASELAQEGVELIRNLRDNEVAKKTDTGSPSDVLGILPNNNTCIVDYNDTLNDWTTNGCNGIPSPTLTLNGAGFYEHTGGAGAYSRRIKIDHPAGSDVARVVSVVTWPGSTAVLNGPIGMAISTCTTLTKCVYTELLLNRSK